MISMEIQGMNTSTCHCDAQCVFYHKIKLSFKLLMTLFGYISDPGIDNEVNLDEVKRISSVCSDNDLLLNSTEIRELIFSTKVPKCLQYWLVM